MKKDIFSRENAPVYFTKNMDHPVNWFEDILGWHSNIVKRDEQGNGCYGAVFETPSEIEITHLAPFNGIHLFYGEPQKSFISFMQAQGIEKMYEYVASNGWNKITEVVTKP